MFTHVSSRDLGYAGNDYDDFAFVILATETAGPGTILTGTARNPAGLM